MSSERWAQCNFDGKPIHPDDQAIVDKFTEWLALPKDQRYAPEWHEFLGITSDGSDSAGAPAHARSQNVGGWSVKTSHWRYVSP